MFVNDLLRNYGDTYVALVVQLVVGQFQLVEADHLAHPRLSRGRGVRVDVDSGRHRRVGVPRYHPLGAVVHVPSEVREGDALVLPKVHLVCAKIGQKWILLSAESPGDCGNRTSVEVSEFSLT